MSKAEDILQVIARGETSRMQMKERITDKYEVACELVAFSNSKGGCLIVGVNDKTCSINALSYSETQETVGLLGNMATENVLPSILIDVETINVEGGNIVVANVKEGLNKPYHDNRGIVWVKNGADKRKVFDNSELAEMMSQCGNFSPDATAVRGASMEDIDGGTLNLYLRNRFGTALATKGIGADSLAHATTDEICSLIASGLTTEKMLRNLRLMMPDGTLTVAAVMLFGKSTQKWLPMITAKCISYQGNDIGGTRFKDKVADSDIEGNLLHQFNTIMAFYRRNLRTIQSGDEFNTQGELEIPLTSLVELTVNALVHRSLTSKAPIRILLFENRLEIHSPGLLPGGLSVDDILTGISMPRNETLFAHAIYLLPYTGVGSGIRRALAENVDIKFVNNERTNEFVIMINIAKPVDKVTKSGTEVTMSHDKVSDLDTDLDTNLDTNLDTQRKKTGKSSSTLTKKQKDILNFCTVPRTSKEILERMGLSNHSANRERHIKPLVVAGLLEMTNPDNPNASNQKYRKAKMKTEEEKG